jgi:flavin reductase (DIM6/NTAB) family NADH-FMN oxidoreductase RutF
VKKSVPPRTWLFPRPAVLLSARNQAGKDNIMTASWVGVACSAPPTITVGIRKSRFSHGLVVASREFVVNIPTSKQEDCVEFCGTKSGAEVDKFQALGLTRGQAELVNAPTVAECPINLECKVKHVLPLGSHDLFVAEIVRIQADPLLLTDAGDVNEDALDALAWGTSRYYRLVRVR